MEALRDGPAISPELVQRRSGADRETLLCDLVRLARALADILAIPLPKGTGNAHTALELVAERITFDSDGEGFWKFRSAFAAAAKAHLDR
ncbi:hypothetical protein SFOMI_0624 [Sphingobium fuliginis]|uniref:Uncharacterized protein n=2 Tax=Sphingobium fuliginis (strain ATCC 27551) TaxID=336203 RepID=A0A292YZ38_SPHSA|nr:hypothetical protein SFOMI_0624 [Sphingobium fuliginis]